MSRREAWEREEGEGEGRAEPEATIMAVMLAEGGGGKGGGVGGGGGGGRGGAGVRDSRSRPYGDWRGWGSVVVVELGGVSDGEVGGVRETLAVLAMMSWIKWCDARVLTLMDVRRGKPVCVCVCVGRRGTMSRIYAKGLLSISRLFSPSNESDRRGQPSW